MSKRGKIRIFSFAAVLVLVLGGFYIESHAMLVTSRTELEYNYRRALNDLTDYISNIEKSLEKAAFANTSTMQGNISAELFEQSSGAKASMATLPFSHEKTEKISRFVSQVGDYAMALSRKSAAGQQADEKELETLAVMRDYAGKLLEALEEMQAHLSVDKAQIGKAKSLMNNVDKIDELPKFDDNMDEVAQEFADFPELLYDGPFSDHIMQSESLYLKDKTELPASEAKAKAAEFLQCQETELQERGTSETALSAYVFTGNYGTVHVTKRGGEISYYKRTGAIENKNLDYEDALIIASDFLTKNGIDSFKESYYIINDNSCTINFSYLDKSSQEDVICYPDLIKVVIELDKGKAIEYDASGYLMNHHPRDIQLPALSLEEAEESVSKKLTIEDHALAITPTPGLSEVMCYEFKCKAEDGTDVLVYINSETGLEEQIFILTYSDNGILTF